MGDVQFPFFGRWEPTTFIFRGSKPLFFMVLGSKVMGGLFGSSLWQIFFVIMDSQFPFVWIVENGPPSLQKT